MFLNEKKQDNNNKLPLRGCLQSYNNLEYILLELYRHPLKAFIKNDSLIQELNSENVF